MDELNEFTREELIRIARVTSIDPGDLEIILVDLCNEGLHLLKSNPRKIGAYIKDSSRGTLLDHVMENY